MSLSRESRLILVLVVFGVLSVVMLGYMAERYRRLLMPEKQQAAQAPTPNVAPTPAVQPAGEPDVRARVEGYLAVREAIAEAARTLVRPGAKTIEDPVGYSLSNLRDVQLIQHGLTPAQYVELRQVEARWLAGDPELDSRLRQAFERRRERLEKAVVPAFDGWER